MWTTWVPRGIGLALFVNATSTVWALTVTPAHTEIRLTPGTTTQAVLNVSNEDKAEVQVDVSKKDWFIPEPNKGMTVERWLDVLGPARFYLKPGESRNVNVTVSCPKE